MAEPADAADSKGAERAKKAGIRGENGAGGPPVVSSHGSSVGNVDVLEQALADALTRAAAAGEWGVVAKLADELAARRRGP